MGRAKKIREKLRDITFTSAQVPVHQCVTCGHNMDAVAAVVKRGEAVRLPEAGDFSICAYCLTVNLFQADGSLRRATTAECERLPDWAREMIAKLEQAFHPTKVV